MKKTLSILLAALLVLSLSAAAFAADESDLAYVQGKGTLVVGITDFEPMDYQNAEGEWIGFDAGRARVFAESLGVEIEFVEIDWDNKILELNGKSIDCVWNGMTLTDEVMSATSCSNAYMRNAQVIVVRAADAEKYADVESMAELSFEEACRHADLRGISPHIMGMIREELPFTFRLLSAMLSRAARLSVTCAKASSSRPALPAIAPSAS